MIVIYLYSDCLCLWYLANGSFSLWLKSYWTNLRLLLCSHKWCFKIESKFLSSVVEVIVPKIYMCLRWIFRLKLKEWKLWRFIYKSTPDLKDSNFLQGKNYLVQENYIFYIIKKQQSTPTNVLSLTDYAHENIVSI